jgi:hypothetical protein
MDALHDHRRRELAGLRSQRRCVSGQRRLGRRHGPRQQRRHGYGCVPKGYYLRLAADGSCALFAATQERNAGAGKQLATGQAANIAGQQWHNVKLQFSGTTITGFVDGVQVLTATDSLYPAGMAGLITGDVRDRNTALFDNLLINAVGAAAPSRRPSRQRRRRSTNCSRRRCHDPTVGRGLSPTGFSGISGIKPDLQRKVTAPVMARLPVNRRGAVLPVRQAHPFDRLRMTLSGVEWVRAPNLSRGCALSVSRHQSRAQQDCAPTRIGPDPAA